MATVDINTALPSDKSQGNLPDGHSVSERPSLVNGWGASLRAYGLYSTSAMLSRGFGPSPSSGLSAQHLSSVHKWHA